MARKQKPPAVVAELGRPETSEETAARKARDSRLYRQRKTVNNLVFSLLVSLGLVLLMVLIVPRGAGGFEDHEVDVQELAEQASPSAGHALVAPEVPDGWKAKQAELRHDSDGQITYWYIGYTTADERYAAVVQAFTADGSPVEERWIATQLEQQSATGADRIGGVDWTVYDHADRSPDEANMLFGMEGEAGGTALLVYGTDRAETIMTLAASVAEQATSAGPGDQAASDDDEGASE